MVLIAGDIARGSSLHLSDRMRKTIPDGLTLAVLVPCPFYLVRGGSHTPEKTIGKARSGDLGVGHGAWHLLCVMG
jgi:hypothetical protein